MKPDAERAAIAIVAQRLSVQFPDIAPSVVSRVVSDTHQQFADHPTRDYVPVLVADAARDRLRVLRSAR